MSRWGWITARLALGCVFAYAGLMKLLEPAANFQAALDRYRLVPPAAAPFLAQAIPWVEWLLGMFLVVGFATRASAFALGLLSLGFIGVLSDPFVWRQAAEQCGCFGESGIRLTVGQAYALDWFCLGLAGMLFSRRRHPKIFMEYFRGCLI